MFGNTDLTARLGATPHDDTPATIIAYARSLADMGLPVLLIQPGTKFPLDMRTAAEKKASPAGGVHMATTDRNVLKKYVTRAMADKPAKGAPSPVGVPNFAVRLSGSGYVVADADTPAEVDALKTFLADSFGGRDKVPGPTVSTPGTADGSHSGGGHWWFRLPEGMELDTETLPASMRISTHMDDGSTQSFSLLVGDSYVLVPPSSRPEGAYQLVTPDVELPEVLLKELNTHLRVARERTQRTQEYTRRVTAGEMGDLEKQVADWSSQVSWDDVLSPAGWVDTGMVDSCGCPIWTAPGTHSSPKSATTHEASCTQPRVDVFNPPIHIWTDNPGEQLEQHIATRGSKTISKLWCWALLHHDGDMSAALSAAGIESDPTGQVFTPDTAPAVDGSVSNADSTAGVSNTDSALDSPAPPVSFGGWEPPREYLPPTESVTTPDGIDMWQWWKVPQPDDMDDISHSLPVLGKLSSFVDMPAPTYVVEGFLEHGGLTSVIGPSGIGKSGVVLDMAACIATGQRWHGRKTKQVPVMYVAGEGVSGAVSRLQAWQKATGVDIPDGAMWVVGEAVLLGAPTPVWTALARQIRYHGIGLVIFDTLARMSAGLDENSASDMGKAVRIFDRIRSSTGAGVMFVHHTARGTTHGRGSTSLLGAVDSEVLVTDTMRDGKPFKQDELDNYVDADGNALPGVPVCVQVTKQKNAADGAYEYLCRTSQHNSLVITDVDGNALSPGFGMSGGAVVGHVLPESLSDTAQRVADYVAQYRSGVKMPTITDIRAGVAPDTARRDKPAVAWRNVINLAVDRALEMGLIHKIGAEYSVEPPLD